VATNESERYLTELAKRSFLKLWTLPNPYRSPGKELADLLVVFGNDIIVFSDKASTFDGKNASHGWVRWYRTTIDESIKQLAGAARILKNSTASLYVDRRATQRLQFDLPESADRRLHLIAVARPEHDPTVTPVGWQPLMYADRGQSSPVPFEVGRCDADGHFVHVFDGQTLDLLLMHLDTAPDFICYLESRENALCGRERVTFSEPDLLALATYSWMRGRGFSVVLPEADANGLTNVPLGLCGSSTPIQIRQLTRAERTSRA
jgi:hypothetical protein